MARSVLILFTLVIFTILMGCDSSKIIKENLDIILADDLIAVSEGIPKDKLHKKIYTIII